MKVQLGVKITYLNGYMNLDCIANPNNKDIILANPSDLNSLIDTNEIDEVFLVNDTLDYLPIQARQQALHHWITRLAHGGTIIITGLDPIVAAHLIHRGDIDGLQANNVIYGIGRKSFCPPQVNIDIAMSTGQMEFVDIKINGYNYVVQLKRK